ncbi:zinc finger CCCH domain-containing protein 10 [Astyanax mexicanus]|uniref:Zinc finger CCCH domain-containing protein 10 n=2 Tax=Astyanax mexicanus TaxID=7994 RepID=A0A8B9JDX2_ASTMX|nr:zinc finger CCCH domain-containing protein 10 [Astyanax mexicanus]XP_022517735.1 zinc finger CCCH domain-containing protein 10 [Astyanax mexicanus]KAG9259418.1 zinc finger CCCH domain-containing protein 10 [Astyanax mexicanus]KAG9277692.1 zinc finger CCCH domain-containing protein 10 [Astyanax mexicanus]
MQDSFLVALSAMPDRDSTYLAGGGGGGSSAVGVGAVIVGEDGGASSSLSGGGGGISGSTAGCGGVGGGSGTMGCGGALGNGHNCGGASGGFGSSLALDGVCRDFLRNVCKRGKRCRFRHPDFNEVPDLGVQKNEFIFCHDHQNKECVRINCRFVHGSKEDEDYYKKTGELPLWLRWKVAAGLGLSPADLPQNRGEAPICRDYLKGECQRGNKCKFRHVRKDHEHEASRVGMGGMIGVAGAVSGMVNTGGGGVGGSGGACGGMSGLVGGGVGNLMGMGSPNLGGCREQVLCSGGGGGSMGSCLAMGTASQRRYDRGACSVYDPLFENGLFDAGSLEAPVDHTTLQLKRRRLEGLRLADGASGGHYELGVQATMTTRPLEYRLLEEENALLRKRVEELKKQVSNLIATNEVLLEQNAQFRSQPKVMTLSSTPAPAEQSLAPPVGSVSSYNHGIAQTHTTLSSAGLQPRPVTQQDLVAPAGAPTAPPANAAPPTAPPPHLNPEIAPLSAALAQTIAQGMAPPVSMAPVAVSVAPVAVSMAQPMPGITISHATTPMVSYPIASQSMRITTLPH